MRWRKWIGILALFGVLVHAGALVRHNAAMASAALQHQVLLADLTQICHGGSGTGTLDPADLPYVPPPSDAQNGCPICSGLMPALAISAPPAVPSFVLTPAPALFHVEAQRGGADGHAVCPPARGPPQRA